jgi:hypothetical protein
MPKIKSYHPTLRVSGTNEAIKLGLDDWYEDWEILQKLGEAFGARTVGEVLQKIKAGQIPKQAISGILECKVGKPEGHCISVQTDTLLI